MIVVYRPHDGGASIAKIEIPAKSFKTIDSIVRFYNDKDAFIWSVREDDFYNAYRSDDDITKFKLDPMTAEFTEKIS